jgi:aspartate kinase
MDVIVQKFGGTSVSSEVGQRAALEKVEAALSEGYASVVVVSAMGRRGAPYATDTLAQLISPQGEKAWLRDRDLLISCGEVISCVVFADQLRRAGHPACALTGSQAGILTDDEYSQGQCLHLTPVRIQQLLDQGVIPVVAGFQGATMNGEVVTLGRGGSDITAALLGYALRAERVEIFTDVDGIMTADPRVVDKAQVLSEISYDEVFQMADQGAKVIHPRAVEVAQRANIPLVVRNTFSQHPGTRISAGVLSAESHLYGDVLSAIAQMPGRTQLRVRAVTPQQQSELLRLLARRGISIDLINLVEDHCSMTITDDQTEEAREIMESMGLDSTLQTGCTKVSAIGCRMKGRPGVMSRIAQALLAANVTLLQTADSHTTIACLVPSSQADIAVRALHHEFGLDSEDQ